LTLQARPKLAQAKPARTALALLAWVAGAPAGFAAAALAQAAAAHLVCQWSWQPGAPPWFVQALVAAALAWSGALCI
jgi:hypothetical protein